MPNKPIKIEIVTRGELPTCANLCGEDWTRADVQATLCEAIRHRFGENMQIVFTDASKKDAVVLKYKKETFPQLLVDGQLRIAGQFDARQVLQAVETQIELRV